VYVSCSILKRLLLGALVLSYVDVALARPADKGDILINVNVNYRLGYRDGSWVPIDVVVANTAYDVRGYVEVRTYVGDNLQSPIYRIPAQSPKSSKKRFRLHCRLDGATHIEAMLYHKNKPVQPVPALLMVRPINVEDLLGLVLDEEPTDYSFLNAAFHTQDQAVRFYREEVPKGAVHLLADYPQCYEPYDVIILGDIEPGRVAMRHRALLRRYVLEGGVLVVCTGENAPKFRGSWVEELTGVAIGSTSRVNGVVLAERVFEPSEQEGTKPHREGRFAQLTPFDPAVKVRGRDAVLATLRPFGSGFVATLAVDAASHLLQDTAGYKRLWCDLCSYRQERGGLNYNSATQLYVQRLPRISGIKLFSKASVMLYLLLYFGAGIVGNWLICNALKRRELAWLFLVLFSAGFTAYAMVFGTAGRAKSTQLDQVEVVRVSQHGGSSEIRSVLGLITARTSHLSLGLRNEFSLAEDVTTLNPMDMRLSYGSAETRPFYLTQGPSPRIDDFMVGASELRLVQVHTETQAPGGIEGSLTFDEGGFHGTLVNNTGFVLLDPFVMVGGRRYPAQTTKEGIVVKTQAPVSDRRSAAGAATFSRRRPRGMQEWRTRPPKSGKQAQRRWENQERKSLYDAFLSQLFAADAFDAAPNERLGPFLVAWVKGGPLGMVQMEEPAENESGATILVADIDVRRRGDKRAIYQDLRVRIADGRWQVYHSLEIDSWNRETYRLHLFTPRVLSRRTPVVIEVPPRLQRQEAKEMIVTLFWTTPYDLDFAFRPNGAGVNWPQEHQTAMNKKYMSSDRIYQGTRTYRLDDWQYYCDRMSDVISGTIWDEGQLSYGDNQVGVALSAKLLTTGSLLESEDWKAWQ